ncbi:MAG TPA: hydantoinase B/oxoprolinase family protein [Gaiellaceae bacterium]|nr:hydantoinase B/oxoprolinase family protein [Gaiellaceae bacterium]
MTRLDPVAVEVIGNRLLSVVDEQQAALVRTAFSTIVRESEDLACGVFDARGFMVAQSLTGTPGHINAMATGMRHIVAAAEDAAPGDVFVTNDPWLTSGQVNDFTVATPVFHRDRLAGWFANCCHSPDVGGRVLSGDAAEVFEEGLRVPIMRLFRAGEPNEELLGIVRANVRTPDETVGDLYAQTACNDVGARSLRALLDEFELPTLAPVADEIVGRSEQAMRAAIRELRDGVYEGETTSDGVDGEAVRLHATVTVDGDEIAIDFAGSSPQSRRGINVVLNYTHAYASFAIKAALAPEVPHNEGSFRPVHVTAPPGSILNALPPAAVGSRHVIGHFIPGVIFLALAEALPGKLLAGGADSVWLNVIRGRLSESDWFSLSIFQAGGTGARATKDGLSATGFPTGVAGVPVEVIETLSPLVQHRRELRRDSGGPGRRRGGLGQLTELSCRSGDEWQISAMVDRTRFPGPPLEGGRAGALGEFARDGEHLPPKRLVRLAPGDRLTLNPPGGAGYGDPREREPELVLRDVIDGYVSLAAAERDYGVRIVYTGPPDALVRTPDMYRLEGRRK